MRIVVLGATGMVGGAIITEALDRGHHVTGLSRRSSATLTAIDSTPAPAMSPTLRHCIRCFAKLTRWCSRSGYRQAKNPGSHLSHVVCWMQPSSMALVYSSSAGPRRCAPRNVLTVS